jgi:outer membrane protein assembly complex protein YaeT
LRTKPSRFCGNSIGLRPSGVLLAAIFVLILHGGIPGWSQVAAGPSISPAAALSNSTASEAAQTDKEPGTLGQPDQSGQADQLGKADQAVQSDQWDQWQGLIVRSISFQGVDRTRLDPLPGQLAQAVGAPFNPADVRRSLRRLFATGLYETIAVAAARLNDGVALVFEGTARTFIGTVSVDGAKGATINTQLDRASELSPGARFTPAKLASALEQMRRTLADNGFHEPKITQTLTPVPREQLVDIAFHVLSGPQARIGSVQVSGDSGMSAEEFRRYAHLRMGAHVDHETANHALAGVLKHYRNQERLEAEIKLESEQYDAGSQRTNFSFSANQGPRVKVQVEGVGLTQERIRHIIPIYEEGTVDEDLLNEGNRRLRDYYQRLGYFDVKVSHAQQSNGAGPTGNANQTASANPPGGAGQVEILFSVVLGSRRRVQRVEIAGNHYFDSATLKDLLSVHAADTLDHHGTYSQALVSADVSALEAIYRNNGFSKVKVTPETSTPNTFVADNSAAPAPGVAKSPSSASKTSPAGEQAAPLAVIYRIEEGEQQRVGTVTLEGASQVDAAQLTPLLNTTAGQLLSPQNLAGDRDTLVTNYLSRGFEHPQVDLTEQTGPSDPANTDVTFHITEGPQEFVRNVLLTGFHFTRPETVARAITIHSGDPLNETALTDTQRNLYEYALFNEVNTAVENPAGDDTRKTVMVQAVEARRWALTYGFGFEAQTGTPHYNCGLVILSGAPCNTQGKTGISPRVLADITRNNLFGRELSASLQGNYGLLEQQIDLLFEDPHFSRNRNFGLTFSGGYANSLDVTTYVSSKLEGGMHWTEHFNTPQPFLSKANSFVYEFNFRRVKVQANSLQVAPSEISLLATAVRVGGPAFTWIRDTSDSRIDPHRGTYTSFQEFLSDKVFGAQAVFNRLDVSNSNYWSFDKGQFVIARNTRYGQERAFGAGSSELIPLPERLYGGGTTSLRGFSINAAGPRDPETGFPVGGAGALINSTELRLPPPTLPFFGDSLSFVVFHDMGNVFANASEAWPSALRTRQPDRATCKDLTLPSTPFPSNSTGIEGACSFNYFSHALGIGLRYHTPAGPIRLDFSYNLNPPIFPVIYNYSNSTAPASVGEAGHFNFFFSLGQTF